MGAVSHNLRAPLTSIEDTVSRLLEDGEQFTAERAQGSLKDILAETQRLNRLVGHLLDTSRVEAGVVHVFFGEADLAPIVDTAVSNLAGGRERVVIDIPQALPLVQTDPTLLERVVTNLLENALAWSLLDSEVRVAVGQVGGRIDLRIIDRGSGMTGDHAAARYRTSGPQATMPSGDTSGLGLAVCQGFLHAMENELLVEPTPGGGTTMVIGLKIANRAAQEQTVPPGQTRAG